jgi:hypothetical protein
MGMSLFSRLSTAVNAAFSSGVSEATTERSSARDHVQQPPAKRSEDSYGGPLSSGKGAFLGKVNFDRKENSSEPGSQSKIQKAGIFIKDFFQKQTVDKLTHFTTEFANLVDEVVGRVNKEVSAEMKEIEKTEAQKGVAKAADQPAPKASESDAVKVTEAVAAARQDRDKTAKAAQDAQVKVKEAQQLYREAKTQLNANLSFPDKVDDIATARSTLAAVKEVLNGAEAVAQEAQAKASDASSACLDIEKQALVDHFVERARASSASASAPATLLANAKKAKDDTAAQASAAEKLYEDALSQANQGLQQEHGAQDATTAADLPMDILKELKQEKESTAEAAKEAAEFYSDVVAQVDPEVRKAVVDKTPLSGSSHDKTVQETKTEATDRSSAQFHIEGTGSFVNIVNSMLANLDDLVLLPPLSEEEKKKMTPEAAEMADIKRRETNDYAMQVCLAKILSQVEQLALERKKIDAAIQALFTQ